MKKKLIIFLIIAIIGAGLLPVKAPVCALANEPVWGRALNKTTYLYNSQDTSSPCFLIPETYYVNIIGESGNFYLVRYQNLPRTVLGYALKSDLYISGIIPENPYLNYQVKAKSGAKGYMSAGAQTHDYIFNSGNQLYYYGRFEKDNITYYYVSAFDTYRYFVKASECETVSFPYNTDPLPIPEGPAIVPEPSPEPTSNGNKMTNKTKIFLVLLLVIPALGATAYLFKPPKTPAAAKKYFYDETDYE